MIRSAAFHWPVLFAFGLLGCAGGLAEQTASVPAREFADTIIVGGTLYDGSGGEARNADLAIRDDRIIYIGNDAEARFAANRKFDASGMVVSPGFIDPHTHAGSDLTAQDKGARANLPFAYQGVTTVVTGNDGAGGFDIRNMANLAETAGIGTNIAYLVGFGAVREAVLGKANRAPDTGELTRMEGLTRQAMCEGAWGFSTGLYYTPQNYAETDEVIALARISAELGGYYDTHMRDESTYNVTVTGALAETLQIGREAGLPVHIAHIKALGPEVWGHSERMIAMIEEARANGQHVTADQYPWEASGTRISSALVPRAALEGGLSALRERLADAAQHAAIRNGMISAIERRGGAGRLLITGQLSGANVEVGQTLAQLAQARNLEPVDAAISVLKEGDARLASFNMDPADIAAFASQNWVVTGSDGSNGHPRKYASFPKAYRDLVHGGGMSLTRFIRRSSGQTADIIGLDKRGYLREGYFADVLVFDPARFAPNASYDTPRKLSSGVIHLFVNGTPMIVDKTYMGNLPGRPLLKDTQC